MRNILVIENDEIMLKAIKNILHKDGFTVYMARDGKEASEMLDVATYDIVITDLMLPYANGLEIVSKIRADIAKNDVGIIVISSVGGEDTISEAFRLGADEYIKKPIIASALLMQIRRLLADTQSAVPM